MQLQDLFNHAMNTTEEVLTPAQLESAFVVSCSIFFAEVLINIEEGKEDTTMDIVHNMGGHQRVLPKSFDDFNLPVLYYEDFRMVCEYVILSTSFKNLNMLKNIRVEESIAQIPTDYTQIREILRRRHNIYGTTSITL